MAQLPISPQANAKRAAHREPGVTIRVFLVIVLTMTFFGTLRWAMNVTQANAKQVSRNLTRLKKRLGTESKVSAPKSGVPGPIIEPEEIGPERGRTSKAKQK